MGRRALAAAVGLCLLAEAGFSIVQPPFPRPNGWYTQEWSQYGQDDWHGNLFYAPFTSPPGIAGFRTSYIWRPGENNTLEYKMAGPAVTQYFPLASLGQMGFLFTLENERYKPNNDILRVGFIGIWSFEPDESTFSHDVAHLRWNDCTYAGSPIVQSDLNTAVIWAFGDCGPSYARYQGQLAIVQLTAAVEMSGGSPPVQQRRYRAELVGLGLLDIDEGMNNRRIAQPPVLGLDGIIFVDEHADDPAGNESLIYQLRFNEANDTYITPWALPLSFGSDPNIPLPPGEVIRNPYEGYHATTAPAVWLSQIAVVGAKMTWGSANAIFAFDPKTGALLWRRQFTDWNSGNIMPDPVVTDTAIIFGTDNGRAYVLNHDGTIRWSTDYSARVTYQTDPYSSPALTATAKLYGPALQADGEYAYFGGSDGRVHRFGVTTGSRVSSDTLLYFRHEWGDQNGLTVIKPCPIRTTPAVGGNEFLVVTCATDNPSYAGDPDARPGEVRGAAYGRNVSYVCAMSIPDMTFNPDVSQHCGHSFDPDDAVFECSAGRFGIVPLEDCPNGRIFSDPFAPCQGWGREYDWVTNSYSVSNPNADTSFYGEDAGGVSLAEGFVLATNASGWLMAIPSSETFSGGSWGGSSPLNPIPPDYNMAPPLGPIRVYPNPFDPDKAVRGTVKFSNLPFATRIEIYSLAHERVISLSEDGNHFAEWDGRNASGQEVATGVYLYKIFLPEGPPETGRIALVRP